MKNIKGYREMIERSRQQESLNKELMDAAYQGNMEEVEILLGKGADVDARDNYSRTTPLHRAATRDNRGLVSLLLDRGAQVDAMDAHGRTPLHVAVRWHNTDTAKLLILRGADPFKAFDGPEEILKFFKGYIDWMEEGPLKTKLLRMQRGKSAFGM